MANGIRRTSQRLLRKSVELRDDVRESTDANLLAVLRVLGLLYGPIDRQARIDHAFQKSRAYRLAPHVGWRHALGGITYFLLMVLVASGVLMAFYYRPSVQEAYPSVQHIVSSIPFGWLVRDMHLWAASLVIVLVVLHLGRTFAEAAYKVPRQTNWTVGLLLLLVVLAFGASGYLLPWEQTGYWTVTEGLDTIDRVPILGGLVAELLRGDEAVSGATLSRFFALHVIILPWLLLGLVSLHFGLVRKHGVAPLAYGTGADREVRFFPHHLMRILATAAVTLAVVISLAVLLPRSFGPAADPGLVPETMPTTWVAAAPWRGMVHYLGAFGPVLLLAIVILLLLLPLLDRSIEVDLRRRPLALTLGAVCLGVLVLASAAGYWLEREPPAEAAVTVEAPTPFGGSETGRIPAVPGADSVTEGGQP
jgi:quinol-cytochrome oxidoreductase complex cytochrome b subunit